MGARRNLFGVRSGLLSEQIELVVVGFDGDFLAGFGSGDRSGYGAGGVVGLLIGNCYAIFAPLRQLFRFDSEGS